MTAGEAKKTHRKKQTQWHCRWRQKNSRLLKKTKAEKKTCLMALSTASNMTAAGDFASDLLIMALERDAHSFNCHEQNLLLSQTDPDRPRQTHRHTDTQTHKHTHKRTRTYIQVHMHVYLYISNANKYK